MDSGIAQRERIVHMGTGFLMRTGKANEDGNNFGIWMACKAGHCFWKLGKLIYMDGDRSCGGEELIKLIWGRECFCRLVTGKPLVPGGASFGIAQNGLIAPVDKNTVVWKQGKVGSLWRRALQRR